MVCQPCRDQDHDNCDDKMVRSEVKKGDRVKVVYTPREGRLYRSCVCQHETIATQPLAPAQVT